MPKTQPDITTTSSRTVYQNKWMRVREDSIRRKDGSDGIYGVVEKPDFAIIIPIDHGILHLVEQFRYPVGARFWELPQGSWESSPDADPQVVARGELMEETGIYAAHIKDVGHLYEAYGYSTQGCHIFIATGLTIGTRAPEFEEQDLITHAFTLAEVEDMARRGDIKDGATIAALGLARLKGLL